MPVIYMTGTQGEEWASKGVPNSVLLVNVCSRAACDRRFATTKQHPANNYVKPPQLAASFIAYRNGQARLRGHR